MQNKYERIRDGNIEIPILHKLSKILVYNTSGHHIFNHIPKYECYLMDYKAEHYFILFLIIKIYKFLICQIYQ